jgi:predicted nucleic acid-binding Zn ribbon protein
MRRPPRELRDVLGDVRERLAPPDLLATVQGRWREAVGEEVAEQSWPDAERSGLVTVRCRSAVWAAELTMLEEGLRMQLNGLLPRQRQVLRLKFTAAPARRRAGERSV